MKRIAIAAQSLDGYITKHAREGTSFTSKEDQVYFRNVLKTFDCSLFGARTFEASKLSILKSLSSERLRVVWTRNPEKFGEYQQEGRLEFYAGDLKTLFSDLETRGGTSVYTECIKQNLVDELWLTLEPLAFGGGKKLFEGEIDVRFELLSTEHLSSNTLLLKYKVY
jgi:dihydrofolate reductase